MKKVALFLMIVIFWSCSSEKKTSNQSQEQVAEAAEEPVEELSEAKKLIKESVEAIGGVDRFSSLKDVEYTYSYVDPEGKTDISTERYVFDGELSWAKYTKHDKFVMPGQEGEVVQGYDGESTWCMMNGELMADTLQAVKLADFLRKTNYYWFAMQFKLLDPGLNYEMKGQQEVDGITYHKVAVSFENNVGDAQDDYVLYVNPETKLIDQFLFTVRDFGVENPFLMKVKYEEIDGVKLTTYRKYAPANWEGEVQQEAWAEEISENIKFNNGFDASLFERPEQG